MKTSDHNRKAAFSIVTSAVYRAGARQASTRYTTTTSSHTSACRRSDAAAFGDGLQKPSEGRSCARSASLNGLPTREKDRPPALVRRFLPGPKKRFRPGSGPIVAAQKKAVCPRGKSVTKTDKVGSRCSIGTCHFVPTFPQVLNETTSPCQRYTRCTYRGLRASTPHYPLCGDTSAVQAVSTSYEAILVTLQEGSVGRTATGAVQQRLTLSFLLSR